MRVDVVVVDDGEGPLAVADTGGQVAQDVAAAYRRRGLESDVVVLTRRHSPGHDASPPDEFTATSALGEQLVRHHQRRVRPDVVQAQGWAASAAALVARRHTGVPVVVRLTEEGPGGSEVTSRRGAARVACLRAADAVSVWSDDDRHLAVSCGAAPERVFVAVDGVLSSDPPVKHTNDAERPTVVTPLGPTPSAGAPALVAAVRRIPDAQLVVGCRRGQEQEASRLVSWSARNGLGERVRVAVPRSSDEVRSLITDAGVVACVPRRPGGASAVLRAMTMAKPVVVSDVPVLRDIVTHRVTGSVVRPDHPEALASALAAAVNDPFRAEAWGVAGYDRVVCRFDWDVVVADHEKVCRVAAGEGSWMSTRS